MKEIWHTSPQKSRRASGRSIIISGAIISAFWYRYLAGIRIDGPGRVEFAPMFSERVKNVCAEHVFAEGTLRVEIYRDGNSAHCRISVPPRISARVSSPRGWASDAAELVCGENEVVFSKLG